MAKAAIATPLYIASVWTLLISYQLFTETAVNTVVQKVSMYWPSIGGWLNHRIDVIVFVHAFAWIFVLASMTPSVILGRGKSMFALFVLCLALTFVAVSGQEILPLLIGKELVERILTLAIWLKKNPYLAGLYLSMPYLIMLIADLTQKRGHRLEEEPKEPEGVPTEEQQPTTAEQAEHETLMQTWQN